MLNGMGDYLDNQVGSLNWIECYVLARALNNTKQFVKLMANQLSPASASIFLARWAAIYNALGLGNATAIQNNIELRQAEFGTPPILSNLITYLQNQLGSIFIDLETVPELQPFATNDGYNQILVDGYQYQSPLSRTMVYVWQPRDNKDNLLMPNNIFNATVESYRQTIENWSPAYSEFITMNLTNRGNFDGYGQGYNGFNFNNYLDGYNVISGTAGSTTITGVNTTFLLYNTGATGDFAGAVNEGFNPPLQVVDDLGVRQTYFVSSVQTNTKLTLTTPIINNITSRTYRTLGMIMDTNGMLDFGGLFNL